MIMLAGMSLGTDLKRYSRGLMPRIALITIIVMPLLYGAMYLWAFWNPFAEVNKVPVALVNEDRGAQAQGLDVVTWAGRGPAITCRRPGGPGAAGLRAARPP